MVDFHISQNVQVCICEVSLKNNKTASVHSYSYLHKFKAVLYNLIAVKDRKSK